ncbi:MAG: hypothetical protein MJ092_00050 [Lachnospiraceae bacterium]|nr:hypothetical protein [Lachnospiraceae bacterium]
MNYYDPMFYIASEKMPFTIRIEVWLKEETVDPDILTYAISKAIQRYPYYAIQVEKQTITTDGEPREELVTVPNERPIVVYPGPNVYPLGSPEVNYHMLALSYYKNQIYFYASHVFTDGSGYFPYIKTVLYYYLCKRHNVELDSTGIRLAGEPFLAGEVGNPYPEEKMAVAEPLGKSKELNCFRLKDGGYVTDHDATVFRFRVNKKDMLEFSEDHDGSPWALLSSLMVKAIWDLHPQEEKDIVSAPSFNLRPGLGNSSNYRMLCRALKLSYPKKVKDWPILKLCTISRTMLALQSHPDNVLVYAQKMRQRMEEILAIPSLEEKKRIMGEMALKDSIDNTFSISYVGRIDLGSIEPYLDAIYNLTDGSTYETAFIEVSAVNDSFDIAFLQGFSSDVYYEALLDQLSKYGLFFKKEGSSALTVPKIVLP